MHATRAGWPRKRTTVPTLCARTVHFCGTPRHQMITLERAGNHPDDNSAGLYSPRLVPTVTTEERLLRRNPLVALAAAHLICRNAKTHGRLSRTFRARGSGTNRDEVA